MKWLRAMENMRLLKLATIKEGLLYGYCIIGENTKKAIFYVLAKFHNSPGEPFSLKQLIADFRGTEETKESERKLWEEKFIKALG